MVKAAPKRIVIIEDDHFHIKVVSDGIRARLGDVDIDFIIVTSERDFLARLGTIAAQSPALVIIDQMIPYGIDQFADENEEEQKAALKLNGFRGGSRCYEALRRQAGMEATPVVFYTILHQEDVPPGVIHVKKSGGQLKELLDKTLSALA
jgi:CheY-like chemotaxis protein